MKPQGEPDYDPLFKVTPLLDRLNVALYAVEQEEIHWIDEQIIPFKERSVYKQYIKNKPHKWGFKVFARAGVSGMVYDFSIYIGKSIIHWKINAATWPIRNFRKCFLHLTKYFKPTSNFKVFFDNWLSSIDLDQALKRNNIWTIGTIRPNRLKNCKLEDDKVLKEKR